MLTRHRESEAKGAFQARGSHRRRNHGCLGIVINKPALLKSSGRNLEAREAESKIKVARVRNAGHLKGK